MRKTVYKYHYIIGFFVLIWSLVYIFLGRFSTNVFKQAAKPIEYQLLNIPKILDFTFAWDSGWYGSLVQFGYPSELSPVYAFFPLFPFLVSTISNIGINFIVVGFVINLVATFFASLALYKLSREFLDDKYSLYSVLIFLAFPMSMFLFAFYTEAIFCALSFWAIYFARKQSWAYSAAFGALLTSTRLIGMLILVPIAIEYLRSKDYNIKKVSWDLAWLFIIPLGLLSYMVFSKIRVGSYLSFLEAYKLGEWSYQVFNLNFVETIIKSIWQIKYSGEILVLIPVICWLLFLFIAISYRKKLPISYTAYVLVYLIFIVLNSNMTSVNRYVLPLFPIYVATAIYMQKKEVLLAAVIGLMMMCQGVALVMFSNGYWIG